jgi:hypothetical protein
MRTKIMIAGAVVLVVAATGAVLVEAASNNTPPPRQATTNEIQVPTIEPSQHATQNPLVNPNAAGTQTGWQGYGASSGATAEPSGTSAPQSVTPGAGRIERPASASPTAAEVHTERQAYTRLTQLGYSRVEKLRQAGNDGWIAVARKDRRQVTVQIDNGGNVVAER